MADPLLIIRLPHDVTPEDVRRTAESREARTLTALLNVAIAARRVVAKPKSRFRRDYLAACLSDLDKAAE